MASVSSVIFCICIGCTTGEPLLSDHTVDSMFACSPNPELDHALFATDSDSDTCLQAQSPTNHKRPRFASSAGGMRLPDEAIDALKKAVRETRLSNANAKVQAQLEAAELAKVQARLETAERAKVQARLEAEAAERAKVQAQLEAETAERAKLATVLADVSHDPVGLDVETTSADEVEFERDGRVRGAEAEELETQEESGDCRPVVHGEERKGQPYRVLKLAYQGRKPCTELRVDARSGEVHVVAIEDIPKNTLVTHFGESSLWVSDLRRGQVDNVMIYRFCGGSIDTTDSIAKGSWNEEAIGQFVRGAKGAKSGRRGQKANIRIAERDGPLSDKRVQLIANKNIEAGEELLVPKRYGAAIMPVSRP